MRMLFALIMLIFLSADAFAARGAWDVRAGNALYHQAKFQDAIKHYEKAAQKNPAEAAIEYDLGAASYKAGDFDAAVDHFQKALLTDDDKLRKNVDYNLGNSFYQAGIGREDKDIQAAVKHLESSLESLGKARSMDLKDKDVENNYEFVKKELERLKLKQKEQQKQSKQCPRPKQGDQKEPSQSGEQQDQQKDQQQDQQGEKKEQGDKEKQGEGPQEQEQQAGQEQKNGEKPQEKDPAAGQNDQAQISSQKDANAAVDDFERNELPKGLLNLVPQPREERRVQKDW